MTPPLLSRIMKHIVHILAALAVISACGPRDKKPMETPKDELVHRLFTYAENGQIAYGHQDDLSLPGSTPCSLAVTLAALNWGPIKT